MEFLDWNRDGHLSVEEIATVFAALLPCDIAGVQHFIRDHFDVDEEGIISSEELQRLNLWCGQRLPQLLAASPVVPHLELKRTASSEELLRWFDQWDMHGLGELEFKDLRFAFSWALYQAMGDAVNTHTKETVCSLLLAEAELDGEGLVSKDDFVELFAPVLQANLPENGKTAAGSAQGQSNAPESKAGVHLAIMVHMPIEGTTWQFELPQNSTVSKLRSTLAQKRMAQEGFALGPFQLYASGQLLTNDDDLLETHGLGTRVIAQVLPEQDAAMGCTMA